MGATHNQPVEVCNSPRVGFRPEWWPRYDDSNCLVGVLNMCEQLHQDHTGSSDPLRDDERALFIRCLEWVIDNWQRPTCAYDSGVAILIHRTLNERKPKPLGPPDIVCRRHP